VSRDTINSVPRELHAHSAVSPASKSFIADLPRRSNRNAEMKTHYNTVALLLLLLRWQKRINQQLVSHPISTTL